MRESVTYQAILREGREEGLRQGLRQGLQQGEAVLILRQLHRRIGPVDI
jgi:predicted transposase YdaD